MTVIELDNSLETIVPRYVEKNAHQYLLNRFLSDGANSYNWQTKTKTETEEIFATSLPSDAALFHTNYLDYLQDTYGLHHKIVIAPHHFWYTVLAEIAQVVVAKPEMHRSIFTSDPAGKINIIVPCANETEPLRMDALCAEMIGYIPVDAGLFLPSFSTSTEMSRLASLAAFLETCSPFYNYMMLACGHPAVRLDGTKADWESVVSRLGQLESEFAKAGSPVSKWIVDNVGPVAEKLLAALSGSHTDWFKEIFSQKRCGSGSQYVVDGWFSRLFMAQPRGLREVTNFPTHISKVPYTTLPSGTEWKMCFALTHSTPDDDGFMVPDYSWTQIRKLSVPRITVGTDR